MPALDEYDDEDLSWPEFSVDGLSITDSGRRHVDSLLSEAADDWGILGPRIRPLFELGYFDTAVRDACIGIECRLKNWIKNDHWGEKLVDDFMSRLRERNNCTNSQVRTIRSQIRTAFKFIRNEFMHNFVDVDETQCRAILFRLARVRSVIDHIVNLR